MTMGKRFFWLLFAVLAATVLSGCGQPTKIFNDQNLDGWSGFLENPDMRPAIIWSIRDGVLRCDGKPKGYILTDKEYSNYKLHVEWRWPEEPTNSGVFLHVSGTDKIWPATIEAQLKYQHAGDFVALGGTGFAELKEGRVLAKKHKTNEKEPGQWNVYEIICKGDTITLYVNGRLQNKATKTTVSSGKIGLQSEGGPIEFRNITITPFK